jgi:hypothetical protein
MSEVVKKRFNPGVFKGLLLDLEDRCRAETLQAHMMISTHSGLDRRRSRLVEGIARYNMMEKGFHEVCQLHGGSLLEGGIIPQTDLKVFQPFHRFVHGGEGIILGLAAIPTPQATPSKNMSRKAAVTINYTLSPRLDFDGTGPKSGDIFVLFLVSRDASRAGVIQEFAVGVLDSKHEQYLFYEPLELYIEGYADKLAPEDSAEDAGGVVRLKSKLTIYQAPEDVDLSSTKASEEE